MSQISTCKLYLALILAVMGALELAAETPVGRWSKCFSSPPKDSFAAPNGYIPAWHNYWNRLGRADPKNFYHKKCIAYFAYLWERKEEGSNEFELLRSYGLSSTGKDYKWVNYRDYIYKHESCVPVKYKPSEAYLVCYLKKASVKDANGNWIKKDILGFCSANHGSYATYAGDDYWQPEKFTITNARVLCLVTTTRREVMINHVDDINTSNAVSKPVSVLSDATSNDADTSTTWEFSKKWSKKQSSTYSSEHGWRLGVSTTFSSGVLTDAIAKWQTTVSAEASGSYVTGNGEENTDETVYKRSFTIPKRTSFKVSITIFKQVMNLRYRATEKFFDKDNKLLGQNELTGIWKGVTTYSGHTKITQKPLSKMSKH